MTESISHADAHEYAETLLRHFADRLTEWEDAFIRDVQRQLDSGGRLIDKQRDKVDEIMERCARPGSDE